jgi:hypothetical protein
MMKIKHNRKYRLLSCILVISIIVSGFYRTDVKATSDAVVLHEPYFIAGEDGTDYMHYDIVTFGSYPQTDPSGDTKDPIKWRVMEIDGDRVLLWADSILDYRRINNKDADRKWWDTCDVRTWLMNDFAQEAFTVDERMAISHVNHVVEYPETENKYVTVSDTVFLPDMDELYTFNYAGEQWTKENRSFLYWRYATAYAHLAYIKAGRDPANLDGYWLRTSGNQKGVYQYVKQENHGAFSWESLWYNSSIDTSAIELGICPMVYVSKRYLEQTLSAVETYDAIPYDEYEPPYKDTVWVDDDVSNPRYEKQDDGSYKVTYDVVEMGTYPQSDPLGKSTDPINWRVMDVTETKVMLMADSILDYRRYNESEDRNGIYWGSSDIRKWLNENFYEFAFSQQEKEKILETTHETGSKYLTTVYSGKVTDRIMLPSYDCIYTWRQEEKNTLTKDERTAVIWRYPTPYSYRNYKKDIDFGYSGLTYWIETASSNDGSYQFVAEYKVEENPCADVCGVVGSAVCLGVCPVMYVERTDSGVYHKVGETEITTIDSYDLPLYTDVEDDDPSENEGGNTGGNSGNTGESGDTGDENGNIDKENKDDIIGEKSDSTENTGGKVDAVNRSGKTIDIKDASLVKIAEQIYTGSELNPDIILRYNNGMLVKGIDYTLTYTNNTNSGIAYANVTGIGNYSGTVSYAFAIQPRVIDGLNTILKGKDGKIYKTVYTGKRIKPKTAFRLPITVDGVEQRLSPKEGKDYTVSYSNNLKIGTATITYRFYGNYNGIITKDFLIVPDSVTKFSAKIKGDKTILSWNAVKGASGYEIKRSTKKNGKYKVIARIKNKKKYTDQKAKGKKYYYKVRAFGKQGGTRCYGKEVVVRAKR